MRRLPSALVVVMLACAPSTVPGLTDDTRPVQVEAPTGPSCETLCGDLSAFCAQVELAACLVACSEGVSPRSGADVRACLGAAGLACSPAFACTRPAPSRPFASGPFGTAVRDLAGPFTVPTASGDWSFEPEWTGDDSYLFLGRATATANHFAQNLTPLLRASPPNVHYFFGSFSDAAGFDAVKERWRTELALLPEAERRHWTPRVHFVSAPLDQVAGWVGELFRARRASPPRYLGNGLTAFAIDRAQRLREVGMLGRLGSGGTIADLSMLANEALAFDFEAAREARLAAQAATVVTLATQQVAYDRLDVDAPLPADLSGFDALEVDLALECPGHTNDACGAWDYLSHLRLCEAPPLTTNPDGGAPVLLDGGPGQLADGGTNWDCGRELARWITPYWREGRWVTDISAQLPVLGGGTKHLRWTANGQWDPRRTEYVVSLSLRFRAANRGQRPAEVVPLWTGGRLDASYDAAHPARTVAVPADAKKVELVTLLTGHGGNAPYNCNEFCNHEHLFSVNGATYRQSFPEATMPNTCAERVTDGVVPNQHGTWYYGRGGWCPGQDVAPWVVDVTGEVLKGQANTLAYRTEFRGAPVATFLGDVQLSAWLVIWK